MIASIRTVACITAIAQLVAPAAAVAQADQSRLTGRVTDGSGAALPGVTVTITSPRVKGPVIIVTDRVGQYLSPALPADTYAVTFELAGFETRTHLAIVLRPGEVFILDRQLGIASLTETVEVVAPAPTPPPPPAPAPPPPPIEIPKRPQPQPVAKELLASVCGPGQPAGPSLALGQIVAHRDDANRRLYGNGDLLVLDVGADLGVSTGQNFVVRRRFRIGDKSLPLKRASFGEQTAGLIQVVETSPGTSVAVVVYSCGEFMAGDSIEPFDALPMWTSLEPGTPQFDEPAHIVFGDHGQVLGSPRQLMVIDRGATQGLQRGQRLTIFRRTHERGPVSTIANAIVVAVRAESATIRIERASDAVTIGDMVALHR